MAKPNLKEHIQELEAEKSKLRAKEGNRSRDRQLCNRRAERARLQLSDSAAANPDPSRLPARLQGGHKDDQGRRCPMCHFKTSPSHDARSHRVQSPKRPFTDAELSAKGMTKV